MRWGQLTLAEDDPGQFDPRFWLDYFRRCHCDAVCLSAGGIVAYYPTDGPSPPPQPLARRPRPIRRAGRAAAARWAWSSSRGPTRTRSDDDVREAHPDWIAVDGGRPAAPALGQARDVGDLRLGPYNFEFMTEVHREIVRSTASTASSSIAGPAHGDLLLRALPAELPGRDGRRPAADADDPRTRRDPRTSPGGTARLLDLWRLWDGEIRAINPRRAVPCRTATPAHEGHRRARPDLFADRQARRGLTPPWANGKAAKEYRAAHGPQANRGHLQRGRRGAVPLDGLGAERGRRSASGSPTASPTASGPGSPSSPERSATAAGSASSRTSTAGTTGPNAYLRNEEPLARVGLSTRSRPPRSTAARARAKAGGPRARVVPGAARGAGPLRDGPRPAPRRRPPRPLQAARPAERRRPVGRAVPAAPRRSSSAAGASWRPSRPRSTTSGDGAGPTSDWRTSSASPFAGGDDGPLRNAYLRLEADPGTGRRHPILAGLEDAPRIIHGIYRLEVAPRRDSRPPLTLIPRYPDLPMEKVYPRVPSTDIAELYLREVGAEPRRLLPLGHRPHLLGGPGHRPRAPARNAVRLGDGRGAAGRGRRAPA